MLIWSGQDFTVDSHGRGLAYTVTRHAPDAPAREVFLQGDDALQFETERNNLETMQADWHGDQILEYLWQHCGYAALAHDRF